MTKFFMTLVFTALPTELLACDQGGFEPPTNGVMRAFIEKWGADKWW